MLLDERKARHVALRLGLKVVGTAELFEQASIIGLVDLPEALAHLAKTNARISLASVAKFDRATLKLRAEEKIRLAEWENASALQLARTEQAKSSSGAREKQPCRGTVRHRGNVRGTCRSNVVDVQESSHRRYGVARVRIILFRAVVNAKHLGIR